MKVSTPYYQYNYKYGATQTSFSGKKSSNVSNAKNDDELKFKDVKENLKIGFKEGALEFWNQIKNPKTLLLGMGAMTLGVGALTTLGISFSACNFIFLGYFAGMAALKIGKGIVNCKKHAKNDQDSLAKKDLQTVGKGLFDLTAITAPYAFTSFLRTLKCTDTFIESAALIKNSKIGKFFSSTKTNFKQSLTSIPVIKNMKLPEFNRVKSVSKWVNTHVSEPMSRLSLIRKFNNIPGKISRIKGKLDVAIVRFIDQKLNLVKLVNKNGIGGRVAAADVLEYMNEFKPAYSKAIYETKEDFGELGSITHRFKRHRSVVEKAKNKKINVNELPENVKDVIGTRVVLDTPEDFEKVYGIIEKLVKEDRLIEIKNYHGVNDKPYLDPERLLKLQSDLQKQGYHFEIGKKPEKATGYRSVQMRLKTKATGKEPGQVYEIQLRGKHVDAVAEFEHESYKTYTDNDKYRSLYKQAAKIDAGEIVERGQQSDIIRQIYSLANRADVKISKMINAIKEMMRLGFGETVQNKK